MIQGLMAVGAVIWFGVAGIGLGFLLEGAIRPFIRRGLYALHVADGRRHPDATEGETELWTRRWGRIGGFVFFFAGAVVINALPVEQHTQRVLLVSFAGALPLVGYGMHWSQRRHRS